MLAGKARAFMEAEFGPPHDPDRGERVLVGGMRNLRLSYPRNVYLVTIPEGYNRPEHIEWPLAHAMYQRVTYMMRDGLGTKYWVDSMLSCQSGWEMYVASGRAFYPQLQRERSRRLSTAPSVCELEKATRLLPYANLWREQPDWIYRVIDSWAAALRSISGWRHFKTLLTAKNWDEWLAGLAPRQASVAARLLAIAPATGSQPADAPSQSSQAPDVLFAWALYHLGRTEEALVECGRLEMLEDARGALECASACFEDLGRYSEAVEAMLRMDQMRPFTAAERHSFGLQLMVAGRLAEAKTELSSALEEAPGDALLRYNLGVVLREQGRSDEARKEWETALGLEQNEGSRSIIELALGVTTPGAKQDPQS